MQAAVSDPFSLLHRVLWPGPTAVLVALHPQIHVCLPCDSIV